MTKPFSVLFKTAFTILVACSAIPAFAQRGGGGQLGGGGFHGGGGGAFHGGGGGGFQGGGGMRSSGGGGPRGGSYSPPSAGSGAPRASSPAPLTSRGGFTPPPGNNYSRPGGNFAGGNQRFGNSLSAPPAVADGRWHSFGGPGGGRGPSGVQSQAAPSNNAGGFHVFSGNRRGGSTGSVRSFSGQGGEVWENSPVARNVVPKSQSLSTLHNSVSGSLAASSGFRSSSSLTASSRFASRPAFVGNRGFSGGLNARNSVQQLRGFPRSGRGCWNCGFGFGGWGNRWGWGFGGGWGFGWPWLGFWDPFWFDPWWGAGPAYGYGYYGYPNSNVYIYPDSGYSPPDYNSNPPPQQDNQDNQYNPENSDGNWITPNGPNPSSAANSANLTVPVLIYMKSGEVYTVRDYWMIDGELHYILMDGAQNSVDLEQVDLPRSNTENAKSGVKFIFKSEPNIAAPAQPDAEPGGPNAPASAPAPTQQINAVPQPEART
jgi:hypothetical protein